MDCLPVFGQLTPKLVRSARFFGRVLPLYTCPMLCFSIGPSFNITETAMSCIAPHLLQRAKRLYWSGKFLYGGTESCIPSLSCMVTDIASDISVKVRFPQELWISLLVSCSATLSRGPSRADVYQIAQLMNSKIFVKSVNYHLSTIHCSNDWRRDDNSHLPLF